MNIVTDQNAEATEFDLDAARAAIAAGDPVSFSDIDVIQARKHGKTLRFAVDMVADPIQRRHRRGEFYEARELSHLKALFPLGGTFVDIGANVGNHTLFVAHYLSPTSVIPIEPNPLSIKLLVANVVLNDLIGTVRLDRLGVGIGDENSGGYAMEDRQRNRGAAKMLPGQGDIAVRRGDDILKDVTPSLIKIDVEGMELQALSGLEETLDRARPALLVEVDNVNEDGFLTWVEAARYRVTKTIQRYKLNKNFILTPIKGK